MTLKYIETHLLAFRASLLLLTFYIRVVKLMLSILKTVSCMKQRTSSESSKRQSASEIQRVILHPLIVVPGLPPFNCGCYIATNILISTPQLNRLGLEDMFSYISDYFMHKVVMYVLIAQ